MSDNIKTKHTKNQVFKAFKTLLVTGSKYYHIFTFVALCYFNNQFTTR